MIKHRSSRRGNNTLKNYAAKGGGSTSVVDPKIYEEAIEQHGNKMFDLTFADLDNEYGPDAFPIAWVRQILALYDTFDQDPNSSNSSDSSNSSNSSNSSKEDPWAMQLWEVLEGPGFTEHKSLEEFKQFAEKHGIDVNLLTQNEWINLFNLIKIIQQHPGSTYNPNTNTQSAPTLEDDESVTENNAEDYDEPLDTLEIFLDITPKDLKMLKTTCDPDYVLGKAMSSRGMHSSLKEACVNSDCKYIAKFVQLDPNSYSSKPCFNKRESIVNEFAISKLMSDEGIGPKIYDMCITEDYAMIIMERYDGTLSELLFMDGAALSPSTLNNLLQQIEVMVKRMHSLGVFHRDVHTDNILYKNLADGSYKLVFTDYGLSIMGGNEEAYKLDLLGVRLIKAAVKKIENGFVFDSAEDIKNATFAFELASFGFTRNGVSCDDWI